jgi:putative transposase
MEQGIGDEVRGLERAQGIAFLLHDQSMLPVWKKGDYPWLEDADSQGLQEVIRHLDRAYTNFFDKRGRHPQFKKKHGARQSISYPQRVKLDGSLLYLPKGGWLKAVLHRVVSGTIKTVTVSKNACGHYFASILADDGIPEAEAITQFEQSRIIGIDLGIKDVVTDSRGRKSGNPRFLSGVLKRLRRHQRASSRKIEAAKKRYAAAKAACEGEQAFKLRDFFGTNIGKARLRLAKLHQRVANARNDWQHKLSRQLADEHRAVAAETLNIKGMMMKNRRLSRAIADVGWSGLLTKVAYKLQRKGGQLTKVDQWFPLSKTCSCCGAVNKTLTLAQRSWICTACNTVYDRDTNVSRNIEQQGVLKLKGAGLSVSAHGGCVSPEHCALAAA